jgi:DNA-binding transcriptional ArsR family regulator
VTAAHDVFRAIADPTRRAMLDRLRSGDQSVSALAGPFRITQPAVSQHLRVLRDAGLVRARQVGRERLYRLDPRPLRQIVEWTDAFRNLIADPAGHVWRMSRRE